MRSEGRDAAHRNRWKTAVRGPRVKWHSADSKGGCYIHGGVVLQLENFPQLKAKRNSLISVGEKKMRLADHEDLAQIALIVASITWVSIENGPQRRLQDVDMC